MTVVPGFVEADPTLFEPFLRSALGFVLRLADPGARVTMTADGHGLEVTGQGAGLFDRPIERPFTSPGRATSGGKRTPGAALGLMVARQVADAHGWQLDVQQRSGSVTVRSRWNLRA